jgi:hypothetical protein
MKKMVLFLLVALVSSQVFGLNGACVTFDQNRDLEGFKKVILTWKDPFIQGALWPEYISLVKQAYMNSGKSVPVELDASRLIAIRFVLDNTEEYVNSYFNQSDYLNGVRENDKLSYKEVGGNPSNWAVYERDGLICMYAKIKCCNPQFPKVVNRTKPIVDQKKTEVQEPVRPKAQPQDESYNEEQELRSSPQQQVQVVVVRQETPIYVPVVRRGYYSGGYYGSYYNGYYGGGYYYNSYNQYRYSSPGYGTSYHRPSYQDCIRMPQQRPSYNSSSSGYGTMPRGYSSGNQGGSSSYGHGTMPGGNSSGGYSSGGAGRAR